MLLPDDTNWYWYCIDIKTSKIALTKTLMGTQHGANDFRAMKYIEKDVRLNYGQHAVVVSARLHLMVDGKRSEEPCFVMNPVDGISVEGMRRKGDKKDESTTGIITTGIKQKPKKPTSCEENKQKARPGNSEVFNGWAKPLKNPDPVVHLHHK